MAATAWRWAAATMAIGWVGAAAQTDGKADEAPAAASAKAADDPQWFVGDWHGTLPVGGEGLALAFHIKSAGDGRYAATMDSPDQGAFDLRMDGVKFADKKLTMAIARIGGRFEGIRAGDRIAGTWSQGAARIPLTLQRGAIAPKKRPQTPKPPFPYREVAAKFPGRTAGVELAGTLTLPDGAGPFPAAILLTGSGQQDRDETIFGHKPFLVIADYLTRRGIAVLRYDDRGVGQSKGAYLEATSQDFADDARAALAWLRKRPEIDPKRVGYIGHSEGGLLAAIAAEAEGDLGFVVLLAGPGLAGRDLMPLQIAALARAAGGTAAEAEKAAAAQRATQEQAIAAGTPAERREKIKAALLALLPAELPAAARPAAEAQVAAQAAMASSPWFHFFLTYDPRPALAKLKCPILALNGAKDVQVLPKENLEGLKSALAAAGHPDFTIRELPDLNHLFQKCRSGAPTEYGRIEETIDPSALEALGEWLATKTAPK